MVQTAIHAAVWGHDWSPEGIAPTLADAADIGYDFVVVPLRRFADIQPAGLARVFSRAGLRPMNTCGLSPEQDIGADDPEVRGRGIAHLRQGIQLARDMGSRQIGGVLYGPIHKAAAPLSDAAFMRAAESMHQVAEYACEAGVRLALEVVNRYETPLLYDTQRGLAFIEAIGHDNVSLHLDTFHMSLEESQPFVAMEQALSRMAYLELDQSHRGDAYDGSLDLIAWARRACELGYDGIVGVEAFSRPLLSPDHANALSVWRSRYDEGRDVALHFMQVIRAGFEA